MFLHKQQLGAGVAGYDTARTGKTEEYNGTSWSEQNDMSIARSQLKLQEHRQRCLSV